MQIFTLLTALIKRDTRRRRTKEPGYKTNIK